MSISAYREVTDWSDSEYHVPNHTYLFDGKSNILAYAIENTDEIMVLKNPIKVSTSRRKFVKVIHKKLQALAKTLQSDEKTLQSTNPQWQVKSDSGKVYTVELIGGKYSCNCVGYGYRNKCKHSEQVRNENGSK
jgi:phosphoribosyl-AMP cyclohydrolase